jgi:hypothetical protein
MSTGGGFGAGLTEYEAKFLCWKKSPEDFAFGAGMFCPDN